MEKKTIVILLIAVLLLVAAAVVVWALIKNLAFGFVFLVVVALVALFIVGVLNWRVKNKVRFRRMCRWMVLAVGICAMISMTCYFYPSSPKVYANSDHHALAVEGVETSRTNILLASDSRDALFDDKNLAGRISLQNISPQDSTATLVLDGVCVPVYKIIDVNEKGLVKSRRKEYYVAIEGQENLHTFETGEVVAFMNEQGDTAATLRVEYYQKEREKVKDCFRSKPWRARYIMHHKENDSTIVCDTSTWTYVILKRFSMASLFPGSDTLNGIVLSKISLLRQRTTVSNEIKAVEAKDIPLMVCCERDAGLAMLRTGNRATVLGRRMTLNVRLDNASYAIGLSSNIPDFRLSVDSAGLAVIRYRMPHYRYLATENKGDGNEEYTFMVASTLIDVNGNVSDQLAENILLYDEFDHVDNVHQMQPFYMSFRRGSTRTPLEVTLINENGLSTTVKAGDAMPRIATQDASTRWIVSLDNFKDPDLKRPEEVASPLSSKVMLVLIALFTLFCALSLLVNDDATFSFIEPAIYIVMIVLLAVKFTLLWRVSVFPPLIGIRLAEFNGWRTGMSIFSLLEWVFLLIPILVLLYKVMASQRRDGFSLYSFVFGFVPLFTICVYLCIWVCNWLFSIFSSPWSYLLAVVSALVTLILVVVLYRVLSGVYRWVCKRIFHKDSSTLSEFFTEPPFDITERVDGFLSRFPTQNKVYNTNILIGFANFFMWVLLLVVGFLMRKPAWFCVGVTVIYYFVADAVINLLLGSRASDGRKDRYSYFCHGLFNSILATGIITLLDGGYGMMFIVFVMLSMVIKVFDLYGSNAEKKDDRLIAVLILSCVVVAFITLFRTFIISVYTSGFGRAFVFGAISVGVISFLVAWSVVGLKKLRTGLLLVIVVVSAIGGFCSAALQDLGGEHTVNRILVLSKNPNEILGKGTSVYDMNRFLEASLNDWVLSENLERGEDLDPFFGEGGAGYFKIQPHSNVGVSWMTQVSDLSVSRFVIAEQSRALPFLLILMFFFLTVFSLLHPADRRWARSILIQIPLLLTVQSLLVWMAVTRRFVFVGQDFPMISIISKVNTVMSVIGFLVWILVALSERCNMMSKNDYGSEASRKWYDFANSDTNNEIYRFMFNSACLESLFLIIALFVIFVVSPENFYKGAKHTYDVSECIDATESLIADGAGNSIEALFVEYQDTLIDRVNTVIDSINRTRGRHERKERRIYDISHIGSHSEILLRFCRDMHYEPEKRNQESPIERVFDSDPQYGSFAKTMFDYYLTHVLEHNNINSLIFMVKHRRTDTLDTKITHVRYEFDLSNMYFRQKLPVRLDRSWRGSICSRSAKQDTVVGRYQENNLVVYTLPSSWTKQRCVIVRPSNNALWVVGKNHPRSLNRGECYALTDGESLLGCDLSKYGFGNYIARNVIINARAQFVYPLQSDLFWAYPLSAQMRAYMEGKLAGKDGERMRNKSVDITISTVLTRELYRRIEENAPRGNVAVVVADGNGCVRALIDHKKPQYLLNPNDGRSIRQKEDSLKREGMLNRGREADRYFGNKALLSLDNGPGSSQKPIVWSAVTSQYSGWDWNSLMLANINAHLMREGGNKYNAWSWSGQRLDPRRSTVLRRQMFRSIKSDEGGGVENVTVQSYMSRSSNYYNAVMVQLGSYDRQSLASGTQAVFRPQNSSWLTDDRADHADRYNDSLFPLVRYNSSVYSFAAPLTSQQVMNDNSLLLTGLRDNFNLPTVRQIGRKSSLHPAFETSISSPYAVPEPSFFNNDGRIGYNGQPHELAREAVKMTAIGKNSVWLVSPLAMAEMYGKLISFNRNYTLTLDPDRPVPTYEFFSTDGTPETYLAMRNQQFIVGLEEVYTNAAGTANRVYTSIRQHLPEGCHIYGKTGTIDGKNEKGEDQEDHLLAVIITNRDITQLRTQEDFANLRFYVIYIADFNYRRDGFVWSSNDAAIVNAVLESDEFRTYMEGGR